MSRMPSIDAESRDWIASRAVEMMQVLLHVKDVEYREAYLTLMLSTAFAKGHDAAALETRLQNVARAIAWPPHALEGLT